jgi:CRP-like cAMP-binding protein
LQLPDVSAAPLDLIDRVRMLCTSTVFARARVDSLAEIAGELEEFHADPGTPFWHEHDPAAWGFVVLEGMVNSAAENGFRLAWTPGTSPGLFEALGATPRWHDAVAAEPVRGLRLNAERLFDAFEDDFAMAADVLSVMAARVCLHRRMSCNP